MAIYLDREGVESCISAISTAIGELQSAASSIDGTFNNDLGDYWKGSAFDKCMSTYAEQYQKMLTTTVPDMVTQLKDFINDCEHAIIEVDEQLSGS